MKNVTHPVVLFQGDDLIIKGHYYEVMDKVEKIDGVDYETTSCVELDFTVRVNGKLVNFTESFSLAKNHAGEISINEWSNWYLIVRILGAMGYGFGPREDRFQQSDANSLIKSYVNTIVSWLEFAIVIPNQD